MQTVTSPDRLESSEQEPAGLEQPLEEHQRRSVPRVVLGFVREVLETVVPAVLIALFITRFVGERTVVNGSSMMPNLLPGESLIVEKVSFRLRAPRRGEIVVIRMDGFEEHLIKRIIGLPGETVEARDGLVWIDREPLDEPYLREDMQWNHGPVVVPPLHVFVMGDNRNHSNDSRSFGPVALDRVVGRAWLSVWPWEMFGLIH
jgi:signal peptidase I